MVSHCCIILMFSFLEKVIILLYLLENLIFFLLGMSCSYITDKYLSNFIYLNINTQRIHTNLFDIPNYYKKWTRDINRLNLKNEDWTILEFPCDHVTLAFQCIAGFVLFGDTCMHHIYIIYIRYIYIVYRYKIYEI